MPCDQQSVAERANLTPDQWHQLGVMLLFFGLIAGAGLGTCVTLLIVRPW